MLLSIAYYHKHTDKLTTYFLNGMISWGIRYQELYRPHYSQVCVCGKIEPVGLITGLLLCSGLEYWMVAKLVGVPGLLLNLVRYRDFVQKHTRHEVHDSGQTSTDKHVCFT